MQTRMNCIIVDDEKLSRIGLEDYIKEVSFLNLTDTCSNATEAINIIGSKQVDLMFLDIEMPRITGIDMLKLVRSRPLTIITSAYAHYALASIELDVIDYILKPVSFERFLRAADKAREYFDLRSSPKTPVNKDFFFIKCGPRIEKIFFDDVTFVQSLQNYVVIQTSKNRHICYLTMKIVEAHFPEETFVRVNQSNIISLSKIDYIEGNEVKMGPHSFTIARSNKEEVMKHILNDKLIKRN